MGQWYIIDICYGYKGKVKLHTIIYDSLKKLPFPVKKIAKDFHMEVQKGEIDYNLYRPIGHIITDEEYAYIKNDIEIVATALETQFKQGLDRVTAGSDSLKGFKDVITTNKFNSLFPVVSLEVDTNMRYAYRGGFTWVNEKYQGKEIGEGIVFDVNSLYPSIMYNRDLPYGLPIEFKGEYVPDPNYPLYIQHIRCEFYIKEGKIPTIQLKKNLLFKETEYLKSSNGEVVDLYVTNVDLELMKEHYDLYDIEYCSGWKFRKINGLFNDFIDKWTYVKIHSTGALKTLAKLMLNSLYGKFGSNPNVTGKVPYLKEDGSTGYKKGEEDFKEPIYLPMGIFITSWARDYTIRTAQSCYDRIIYCDTDSIHLEGLEIPESIKDIVDPNKLGYWKHESTFYRAKFIRQKTYMEDCIVNPYYYVKNGQVIMTNAHLDVKCAGMPETVKKKVTFDNFKVGFKSYGKLLPHHVNGGIVLVDTEFTIK